MRAWIFGCWLLFSASAVLAQSAATSPNTPTVAKAARIDFKEKEVDFGDIYQGDVVKHIFTFTNSGNAPLVLTNVSTTCGCTASEWPRDPIFPGEKGQVVVSFDSKNKSGIQNKVITIMSNAATPQDHIKIIANVLPPKAN